MKCRLFALALLASVGTTKLAQAGEPGDNLSDDVLKAYEAKPFDKAEMMGKHQVLGTHHGTQLVADFPCSDICPDYTKRIIHYVLPADKTCRDIGGEERSIFVPRGPAVMRQNFCVPSVIGKQ